MIIKNDKKICGCLIVIAYTEHADRISELWYGLIHVHLMSKTPDVSTNIELSSITGEVGK